MGRKRLNFRRHKPSNLKKMKLQPEMNKHDEENPESDMDMDLDHVIEGKEGEKIKVQITSHSEFTSEEKENNMEMIETISEWLDENGEPDFLPNWHIFCHILIGTNTFFAPSKYIRDISIMNFKCEYIM